jgi:hypothetical protein
MHGTALRDMPCGMQRVAAPRSVGSLVAHVRYSSCAYQLRSLTGECCWLVACLPAEMLGCSVSAAKHNFAVLRDVVERYGGVAVWISPPAVRSMH